MKLRDKFWLWGHPEGRYNNEFGNTQVSRMTPMEGCLYLGVRNTFMVPVGVNVNRRQYNKSFKTLKGVGWECYDAGRNPDVVNPLIEESKDFPNINCVVFDDFVRNGEFRNIPVENLYDIHDRLQTKGVRPLDMWMVLYTHEFGINEQDDNDFMKYIEPFDGIIMWNWKESKAHEIPEKFEIFKKMTPKQRRMFGCYLWNFGEKKASTREWVKWQLDWYREKILAGEAEGVVLHTNTMADLDLDAYDAACEWMDEHGDEEIPD
jgi:hypothetical protein